MHKPQIWTAWCEYSATGEGVTTLARLAHAHDAAECKQEFAAAFDPFWAAFMQCEPGVVRNPVTQSLFTDATFELVERLDGRGAIEVKAEVHYNLA